MLKKFLAAGAVIAGFAGLGFSAPAQADSGTPWPSHNEYNISSIQDVTNICGNSAIGDVVVGIITLNPVTAAGGDTTGCNIAVNQN